MHMHPPAAVEKNAI